MATEFVIVPDDKEFKFKNLCPYCGGNLTYVCNGWEQDDNNLWMADSFDIDCSNEPEIVKEFINNKYRFNVGK